MSGKHQASFVVPAAHPALPGHFPRTPVVPGVVVLDHVLKACESWQQGAVSARALKQVKFHSPLLPDERADVTLELNGDSLSFRVTRGEQAVAQGVFTLANAPDAGVSPGTTAGALTSPGSGPQRQ
jgi:3-hydroxymyristoyl/3-hydroxydecanoyl-(acyl carrier protein) dehydratase